MSPPSLQIEKKKRKTKENMFPNKVAGSDTLDVRCIRVNLSDMA